MTDRSRTRLIVLQVLVLSLLLTLVGRLWFMQVVAGDEYAAAASENGVREVVTPAVRGAILDAQGRPLVQNRTSLVVSVDRAAILDLPNDGERTVRRLADLLGTTYQKLDKKLTLCGTPGAPEPPVCWNGSPYQPIPVAEDVDPDLALQVMEQREDFPGVTAEMTAIRDYPRPFGVNAAHLLGYIGPISAEELAAAEKEDGRRGSTYTSFDLVGRAGLEQIYDDSLRGRAGVKQLAVDSAGNVTGTLAERESRPGDYLVTSIDAHVQRVVEDQLKAAIDRAGTQFDDNTGKYYQANTGAAIVMEVDTGRIVAMASYPDYDPAVWVGGVTNRQYKRLASEKARYPLINRAIAGEYAPASTFKIVSTVAGVAAGNSLYGTYECPGYLDIAGRTFNNYESQPQGYVSFKKGLEVSCDTMFYRMAYNQWLREGGYELEPGQREIWAETARGFGYGKQTGVDLPGEQDGRIPDRQWKQDFYDYMKDYWCNFEEEAPADERDSEYLQQLARENCADGYLFRAGDAVLSAIGQGDTLATPLQVAQSYAALANGGTIYKPQVARAIMSPDGEVVREFEPKKTGTIPASAEVIDYMHEAFLGVTTEPWGTSYYPFHSPTAFPLDQIPVAAKTGTGEAYGKQTTSWFATYAPADDPEYVVLMMVPEGGTGSGTSAPSVRAIYEAIYGVDGSQIDMDAAIIPGGNPIDTLPAINRDGTIELPEDDGLPGSSESGLPATKQEKQQQRRRRRQGWT